MPKTTKPTPAVKAEKPIKMPPGLMCYICGRKYGTTSFEIHVKQCKELWEKTESQKPKNE